MKRHSPAADGRNLILAALMSCGTAACTDSVPVGSISPLPLPTGDADYEMVDFGQVIVPENRQAAGGRDITAAFVRFRSSNPEPAEPIFVLPGGPGFSIFGDPDFARLFIGAWGPIGDVVFVEQRGNYAGLPHLRCAETGAESGTLPSLGETPQQCREVWTAAGVDLDAYNVVEAAADVDDVRRFLGYDKITLSGVSFGSQWALVTMRRFPESIARVFLGGVEGLDHTYDIPSDVLAAMQRIAEYAEQDESLAEHIPDTGLVGALEQVIEGLEKEPARYVDPELGEEVEITADDVRAIARQAMADRDGIAAWPANVLQLHNGDFGVAAAAKRRRAQLPPTPAFFYTLDCASGISDQRARRIAEDPAYHILGLINADYTDNCPTWDVADLGSEFRAPYESDIPVLILQGDWDTSTPIENLAEVVPMFTNVTVVTAHRGSHMTVIHALRDPPVAEHIARFLTTGETTGIPESFDAWVPEFEPFTPR